MSPLCPTQMILIRTGKQSLVEYRTRVWIFASCRSIVGGVYLLADTEIHRQCESIQLTGWLTDHQACNTLQLWPWQRLCVLLALTVG